MATSKRAKQLQELYLQNLQKQEVKKEISYTDEERRMHQSWCFKNDIIIWFEPIDYYQGLIVISEFGIIKRGDNLYKSDLKKIKSKDKNWSEIIFKIYTQKYLENNGKVYGK